MWSKFFHRVLPTRPTAAAGFTLVEVMVAVTILTVGVLATAQVSAVAIKGSNTNEYKVTATNLAREGVELVRNARDSNWQAYAYELQHDQTDQSSPPSKSVHASVYTEKELWDCYNIQASDPPLTCLGRFSAPGVKNLVGYLGVSDSSPYFGNGQVADTGDPRYLVCPVGSPPLYRPPPNTASCLGKAFYRRIEIIPSGKSADGTTSFKVVSHVTWDERYQKLGPAGDIIIEEYLTDWRRFTDAP